MFCIRYRRNASEGATCRFPANSTSLDQSLQKPALNSWSTTFFHFSLIQVLYFFEVQMFSWVKVFLGVVESSVYGAKDVGQVGSLSKFSFKVKESRSERTGVQVLVLGVKVFLWSKGYFKCSRVLESLLVLEFLYFLNKRLPLKASIGVIVRSALTKSVQFSTLQPLFLSFQSS